MTTVNLYICSLASFIAVVVSLKWIMNTVTTMA